MFTKTNLVKSIPTNKQFKQHYCSGIQENKNFVRDYNFKPYQSDQIDALHLATKSFLKYDPRSFKDEGYMKVRALLNHVNNMAKVTPKLEPDTYIKILKASNEPSCLFEFRNENSEVRLKSTEM